MDWGILINPDKSPAPLLEQLCLGIVALMLTFDSSHTTDLTPDRLAAFYRKVGGDYDPLFLDTKPQALSFIYQSIGCAHNLVQSTNPYETPSIPALLPNGFVRWQTIQLLLDPDEHWAYLSRAVEQWDIYDANGRLLPKILPRDAFPSEPDAEMTKWHLDMSAKLEHDYLQRKAYANPSSPPNAGYHYRFSGKDPLSDEEVHPSMPSADPRRPGYQPQGQGHNDGTGTPRHRYQPRRPSGEHPEFSHHRSESTYHREDGGRSGYASPRCPSPSARPDHQHRRTRGREHSSWHSHPRSPERGEPDPEPTSGYTTHEDERDFRRRRSHRTHRQNLSPPEEARARRHSHDAYTRKPVRDLSPHAPRRSHEEVPPPRPRKFNSDGTPLYRPRDERSRSRPPSGINWKDFIFGTPHDPPAPAPEPPGYGRVPRPRPVHHRHHLDPYASDDPRRGSYGGTPAGSRPGSGSGSDHRPRAFSSVGYAAGKSRWTSPPRGCAPKRFPVGQDMPYMPRRPHH